MTELNPNNDLWRSSFWPYQILCTVHKTALYCIEKPYTVFLRTKEIIWKSENNYLFFKRYNQNFCLFTILNWASIKLIEKFPETFWENVKLFERSSPIISFKINCAIDLIIFIFYGRYLSLHRNCGRSSQRKSFKRTIWDIYWIHLRKNL